VLVLQAAREVSYSARTTTPTPGPSRTWPAGPARGSPRASSWCRVGPRACEAGSAFRDVSNLATRFLRLSLTSPGAATGQSDLGYLPKPYPSPSDSCPHDLGGLKILADKLKDSKGEIIGVKAVHVTCTKCNGKPYLTGKFKDTTELQTAARNVNIPDYLPAAQALFARSGADAVWPE
jgi:hypothetical protein